MGNGGTDPYADVEKLAISIAVALALAGGVFREVFVKLGILNEQPWVGEMPEEKPDKAYVPVDLARADLESWDGGLLGRLLKGVKSALEFVVSDKPDAVRKKTGIALVASIAIIPLLAFNALWAMIKFAPSNQKRQQATEAVQQKKEISPAKTYVPPFAIPNDKKMWIVAPGVKPLRNASGALHAI